MLKKYFFTISFISWMVFVTFSSLYSFSDVDTSSLKIPFLDKVVHFTFYFVACILGVLFVRERTAGEMRFNRALLLMLFCAILFGVLVEVLQYLLTVSRTGDIFDGIANSIGSICGALLSKAYYSANGRLKWKS